MSRVAFRLRFGPPVCVSNGIADVLREGVAMFDAASLISEECARGERRSGRTASFNPPIHTSKTKRRGKKVRRAPNGVDAMSIQRIMVATDGSAGASRAVEVAAEFAKAFDADLSIVTFGGNSSAEDISKLARSEGGVGEAIELLSNLILREARERAKSVGAPKIRTSSDWGDAAEGIIDIAHREKADIVVVGRRGRGQLAGLLLGSVSQKVASLASCIVVIVP